MSRTLPLVLFRESVLYNALFERQGNLNEQVYQEIATRLKLKLQEFDRDRNSFAATEAIAQDMRLTNNFRIKETLFSCNHYWGGRIHIWI